MGRDLGWEIESGGSRLRDETRGGGRNPEVGGMLGGIFESEFGASWGLEIESGGLRSRGGVVRLCE